MYLKYFFVALANGLKSSPLDWIIILLFFVNSYWYLVPTRKKVEELLDRVLNTNYAANLSKETKETVANIVNGDQKTESEIVKDAEKVNHWYTVFQNTTSIFPLLGMLGTVVALIPMVKDIGSDIQTNFFAALTSTFWGILSAIISKIIDPLLSDKIEMINKRLSFNN